MEKSTETNAQPFVPDSTEEILLKAVRDKLAALEQDARKELRRLGLPDGQFRSDPQAVTAWLRWKEPQQKDAALGLSFLLERLNLSKVHLNDGHFLHAFYHLLESFSSVLISRALAGYGPAVGTETSAKARRPTDEERQAWQRAVDILHQKYPLRSKSKVQQEIADKFETTRPRIDRWTTWPGDVRPTRAKRS